MKLPELKRYLVREAEMDKEDVECMTPFELAWQDIKDNVLK